jgi:hypothetical protein
MSSGSFVAHNMLREIWYSAEMRWLSMYVHVSDAQILSRGVPDQGLSCGNGNTVILIGDLVLL